MDDVSWGVRSSLRCSLLLESRGIWKWECFQIPQKGPRWWQETDPKVPQMGHLPTTSQASPVVCELEMTTSGPQRPSHSLVMFPLKFLRHRGPRAQEGVTEFSMTGLPHGDQGDWLTQTQHQRPTHYQGVQGSGNKLMGGRGENASGKRLQPS